MAHHQLVILQVPCQLNCTESPFAEPFLHFIPFASSNKRRLLQLRHWTDECASWAHCNCQVFESCGLCQIS